jgi:uroporphyrinogen decarboxylase
VGIAGLLRNAERVDRPPRRVILRGQAISMSESSASFEGLTVAAFESRRGDEMARLIERHGGRPRVSPSLREVPLVNNDQAVDFAKAVMTGEIDVVIVMTGEAFRHLLGAVERRLDVSRFLASLEDITTIARGPKAVEAMQQRQLTPTCEVPEPNTWREVLATIDAHVTVGNRPVGLLEYGKPNPSLTAGLEARGAAVIPLKVYNWALPEDTGPLERNVRALAEGRVDIVLFTSAQQVQNLLLTAGELGRADEVSRGLREALVASIGPSTSGMLRQHDLPVDLEPDQPEMGRLVAEAARHGPQLLRRKRHVAAVLSGPTTDVADPRAPWYDNPFMKACRCEPTEVTPVWLMRQAGRYMAEYRAVREQTSFLELCKNPDLCSEVMVTAVNRLGVDAAIIFSDLLPILEPMGMELEFSTNEGPVIHNPIRQTEDVDRLVELESVEALDFVVDTVAKTRRDLPEDIPLIGFAGAPFTLASYAIEGGGSRSYLHTKTLMYRDAAAWNELMSRLARAVTRYLNAQIAAGCQCVQLFDSWAGCLGPDDYRRHVLPHMKSIISGLTPEVPLISFATGNPALLPQIAAAGPAVVGVDWRVPLDEAWATVGYDRAVQGNLDPAVLLADVDQIRLRTAEILERAGGRPGHIFNLGHGVLQQTPVEHAIALVDAVHELSAQS